MSDTLVLCYHALSERFSAPLAVTPQRFERQIGMLVRRGYRGATFTDAVAAAQGREPGRRGKTLVVTFDDAYRSVLRFALPVLSRLGVPGTVFAPTAFVGAEQPMAWAGIDRWIGGPNEHELVPMSWTELRKLADHGWEIGSHTRSHPHLTDVDDASLRAELLGSRSDCESGMDRPCRSIAYPYGDHDSRVLAAAAAAGYEAGCTLPARLHRPAPLRWPRIGVYHGDDQRRFRLKASRPLRALRSTRLWPEPAGQTPPAADRS